MSVSRLKSNLNKEQSFEHILYHLADVWEKRNYEIRGFRKIIKGYGLQQFEFSAIKDTSYPITERMFREYKNELITRGYIKEVYVRRKDKRPRYVITPLGIVYLVQNMELSDNGIRKCVKIILQYYKGDKKGLEFKKLGKYISTFRVCCDLFRFEDQITIQTKILPNTKVDMLHIPYTLHPKQLEKDFELVSYYLISNMCWLLVSVITPAIQVLESKELVEMYDSLPTKVKKLGKTFGQKVSKHLELQNNLVNEVLTH